MTSPCCLPFRKLRHKGRHACCRPRTVANRLGLSHSERDRLLPSGQGRLFHNRAAWAKFHLSKAGFPESPQCGRFVISAEGRKLLANPPKRPDAKFLLSVPAYREFFSHKQAKELEETASQPDQ